MRTKSINGRLTMPLSLSSRPAGLVFGLGLYARKALVCLLTLSGLMFSAAPVMAAPFLLTVPTHAKGSVISQSPCVTRLSSALAELGYQVQLQYTPSRRALLQASNGQVDGDLARSSKVEIEYTNLRRVPMPCASLKPALYALQQEPMSWKQRPLKKIAYFRGSTRLLNSLTDSLHDYELIYTDSSEQSLKLLKAKRVDAVFISKPLFTKLSQTMPELADGVAQLTPELADVTLYTYLHKRHEALIPQLDRLMHEQKQQKVQQELPQQEPRQQEQRQAANQ